MLRCLLLLTTLSLLTLPRGVARGNAGNTATSGVPPSGRFRADVRWHSSNSSSPDDSDSSDGGLWIEAAALSEALEVLGEPVTGYLEAPVSLEILCRWVHQHLPLRAPPPDVCVDASCRCEDDPVLLDLAASVGAAAQGKADAGPKSCRDVAADPSGVCRADIGKYCPRSCGQCLQGVVLQTSRKKLPLSSDFCRDRHRPPWAWFSSDGKPMDAIPSVSASLFVLELGTWAFPPVAIGSTHVSQFRTAAMSPPIFTSASPLISGHEADEIISVASSKLSDSIVEDYRAGQSTGHTSRTSATARLAPGDSAAVSRIFDLGRQLLNARWNQFEQLQVVRYLSGQYYHQHHDFFEYWKYPQGSDVQRSILKRTHQGTANRVATLLFYLGSTPAGGTNFPLADNSEETEVSWEECGAHGLSFTPEQGHALLFYSVLPNGTLDNRALHAGCPPGDNSTKWVANLWLWNVDVSEYEDLFSTTRPVLKSSAPTESSSSLWIDRSEV